MVKIVLRLYLTVKLPLANGMVAVTELRQTI